LYLNHVGPKCHLTLYYLKEEKMSSKWRHLAKDVKMFITCRPTSHEHNDDERMI